MSDGNVILLNGTKMPAPGKPSELLIDFLEKQLERAKAGEIIGFAGAVLTEDRSATYWCVGFTGGFSMVGALDCVKSLLRRTAMGER